MVVHHELFSNVSMLSTVDDFVRELYSKKNQLQYHSNSVNVLNQLNLHFLD